MSSTDRLMLGPGSDPVSRTVSSTEPALTSKTQVYTVQFISLHLPSSIQSHILRFPCYSLVSLLTNSSKRHALSLEDNSKTQYSAYLICLVSSLAFTTEKQRDLKKIRCLEWPGHLLRVTCHIHLSVLLNRGILRKWTVFIRKVHKKKCLLPISYPSVECLFFPHKICKVSSLLL